MKRFAVNTQNLVFIGVFAEYLNLMIYVHTVFLLNNLFFPQGDCFNSKMLSAGAFCSVYVFRPIGALILGYIADKISQKLVFIISSIIMLLCSTTMLFVPTYDQIGITASIMVSICRMLQGISTMSESIGANIYLTGITKSYFMISLKGLYS